MILAIILLVLFVVGIWLERRTWDYDVLGALMAVISGILLLCHALALILHPLEIKSNLIKYEATKVTLQTARENNTDPLERAAIVKQVSQWNEQIASWQYYNSMWFFDQYIPDEVDDVEPIQ
jgi:hypothetical protein